MTRNPGITRGVEAPVKVTKELRRNISVGNALYNLYVNKTATKVAQKRKIPLVTISNCSFSLPQLFKYHN